MGAELKSHIAKALDIRYEFGHRKISGSDLIDQAFRIIVSKQQGGNGNINPHLHASHMIRGAMPQAASIDNYIEAHNDNPLIAECGKLAIAQCILHSESRSQLYVDRRNGRSKPRFGDLEDTWFNGFFQTIAEGCTKQEIARRFEQISIVTFNYDRCIETYLHFALQNYYGMSVQEATSTMKHLEILHPYGYLGPLEWSQQSPNLEFGAECSSNTLIEMAERLQTFSESTNESISDISRIRSVVRSTQKLAFLGFSFNQQNMDLLFPGGGVEPVETKCFGTAYGLSNSDVETISEQLNLVAGISPNRIRLEQELTCAKLFKEYGRALSLR